ncbi:MAG: EAL domain-containing protein [Deltaproteobacteria bacterium]|nr:EAL domain-containing protein [Deltaproteobacteria bacterium]
MTLINKAALIVAAFTLANIGFGYAIKHNWIDPSFESFEQKSIQRNLTQIAQAVEREINHLESLVYEYSSWDATCDFVVTRSRAFFEDNLTIDVLHTSGINWLIIVDNSGEVVSGPIYDVMTGELVSLAEIPQGHWDLSHPLLAEGELTDSTSGIMLTQTGPVIVASRHILTSTDEGPSRGHVIMGRALDADLIQRVGKQVESEFHIWLAGDPEIPEGALISIERGEPGSVVTIVDTEADEIDAYQILEDLDGNPSIIVGVTLPRELTKSANFIAQLCALWVVFQGGILVFIILVPLNRAIIAPLGALSCQLRTFRKTSELDVELDSDVGGEIGELRREFGNMLKQLENEVMERRKSEEGLRRAAAVFNIATESIVIANSAGIILDVNSAFTEATGLSRVDVLGRSADILATNRHAKGFFGSVISQVAQAGKWEGEIWIRCSAGRSIPAWVSVGCALDDHSEIERVVVVFNDMTERKKSEAVIAHQANYDMLTKLPNRYLLRDRFRRALVRAEREHTSVGLLFIDLDQFKKINDTLGHAAGDEALRHVAARINQGLRDADTAARLGGDEFAVILLEIESAADVDAIAKRILEQVSAPLELNKQDIVMTASIGAAIYPNDSDNDEDLLRNADAAMYRSKQGGGNTVNFFTEEMNESANRRFQVETQLWKALELNEFEVYYQPIVALPEGRMVGVEALLRWENPVLGMVSPAEFVPIAERSGLIVVIGSWVLETACRQVKAWHDAGWTTLRLAVNLSPREVDRGDAVESIRNALSQSGLRAEYLEIEVTERVLLDDVERVTAIFNTIKEFGVRLCIDDFGTGYSSLSYLQSFPFDVLKIDRAFVHGAVGHEDGISLLRAINSMAESLHLEVVAEGVETREQKEMLSELGCGFAQGYFFCRPLSADSFEQGGPIAKWLRDVNASD